MSKLVAAGSGLVPVAAVLVALAAAAAIIGAVLAGLVRYTAAAVGVAMAYLVLIEGVFSGALETFRPWLLSVNFESWIRHGASDWVDKCTTSSEGMYDCQSVQKHVSFGHSAVYLAIVFAVLVVAGALVFRRRDVN